AQLGETDRRAAFLLALSGIVHLTPDAERLPPLAKLHPAVVLAMSATGGENVKRALEDVPARVLGDLPPPFGPAFHELARNEPDISAGDDAVQILAKLGTTSIETEWVAQFLDEQAVSRLRALALLSSQDPKAARHILDIVLNNPNVRIEHPALRWARGWKLISWSSLSSSDQLLILSGIPSGTKLRTEDIAKLFSHPLPSMRVSAIDEALERIRMGHPGALAVLSELKNQPELLDPEQTVLLARLLENPENATVDEVRKWLSLSPPLELVAKLLVATSEEKSATTLDFEAMRFLKDRSWKPSVEDLRKLVLHPDPLTRLFAYSSVYQSVDRDTALTILSQSQKREENREFKEQLRTMIGALAQ
ncbi:MAG: hypothetical protein KDD44_09790, partial [Bdellovibrionales bacterium]|nr:hypothetical protein [Bdellovibrionales bacterium]